MPPAGEQFYADHDQRWQGQFGVSFARADRRLFGSVTTRVDSGIPFEVEDGFDPSTFPDQEALTLVNLETGRAKPRAVVDVMAGTELLRRETTRVELQAGLLNAFDKTYLLHFLSIFNGTHYGAPRTWTARVRLTF